MPANLSNNLKKLLSIGEASIILGVSIDTLRRWDKEGKISSIRPDGKNRYFLKKDIKAIQRSKKFSISEASQVLGISQTTLRRIEERGLIAPQRLSGGDRAYEKKDLDEFLKSKYFANQNASENLTSQAPINPPENPLKEQNVEMEFISEEIREDKKTIYSLLDFRRNMVFGIGSLVLLFLILVSALTFLFLNFPSQTAQYFGYRDSNNKALFASVVDSNGRQVLGASTNIFENLDLIKEVLKPFSRVSLTLVKLISFETYQKVAPLDINDIFVFNGGSGVITKVPISFPKSNYFKIFDTKLINNLNADYIRGKVPTGGDGNLAVINNGHVYGLVVNSSNILDNSITNNDISPDAGISDTKLLQITTSNKVAGSAIQLASGGGIENSSGLSLLRSCGSNQVLIWNGSNWVCADQTAATDALWSLENGLLYPNDLTADVLFGGSSSSSANFHIFGSNSLSGSNPVASLSANTSATGFVIDQKGSGNIFTAGVSGLQLLTLTNAGNVVPGTNAGQDLGSSLFAWRNIYGTTYYSGASAGITTGVPSCVTTNGGIVTGATACSGGGGSPFSELNGAIVPNNSTEDFLIGGQSTASATFHVYANGDVATSGNFSQTGAKTFSTGTGLVSINGNIATNLIPNSNALNLGSPGNNWGNIYGTTYFSGATTGVTATLGCVSSTLGIVTGSGACPAGTPAYDLYWNQTLGALYPNNSTVDFLIGGQSTASAKFAIQNITGARGTQIATLSGRLTLDSSTASIQTTSNQLLTLGGNTTGNIILSPNNGVSGLVSITGSNAFTTGTGLTTLGGNLSVNGTAITLAAGTTIDSSGAISLGTTNATTITLGRLGQNITLPKFTVNGGLLYTDGSGILSQIASTGTSTQCLLGNVTGAPSFGNCTYNPAYDLYWNQTLGALYPNNSTVDFLIGGQSTASAKFSYTGIATGQTIASVSGNLIVMANNGWGGNLGIGTTVPNYKLEVNAGSAVAAGRFTTSDVTGKTLILNSLNSTGNGPGILFTNDTITLGLGQIKVTDVGAYGGNMHFIVHGNTGSNNFPTGNNTALFLQSNGNVGIGTTSPLATLDIRPNTTNGGTLAVASVSGSTNMASLVVDQTGNGDIFTASKSGLPLFTITKAGNLIPGTNGLQDIGSSTRAWNNIYGTTYFSGATTGVTASLGCVSSTLGIVTGSGACPAGTPAYDLYWNQTLGALYPNNSTVDFLIGGQSTASAKFSYTGIATGQTIASVSGSLIVMANNGYGGQIGIGTTLPTADLTFGENGTTARTMNVLTRSTNAAGTPLSISAGTAGSGGSAFAGGALTLSAGNAAGTGNASGGDAIIRLGSGVGSGALGTFRLQDLSANNYLTIGYSSPTTTMTCGLFGSNNCTLTSGATLTLNGSGGSSLTLASGKLSFGTTSPLATLDLRIVNSGGTSNGGTLPVASISGATSFASLVVDQTGNGDIFTASKSGLPLFTITKAGNLIPGTNGLQDIGSSTRAWNNIYGTTYFSGATTGVTASLGCVSSTLGIVTGSGACPAGTPAYDLYWNQTLGALYPNNSTVDFLIGGQSTASAKFSYTGIATGQTIASVSGSLIVMANNGYGGKVGIGTSNPGALLDVSNITTGVNELARLTFRNQIGSGGALTFNGNGFEYSRIASLIGSGGVPQLTFTQSGTEVARFNSSSFGIGTTTPLTTLDVRGNSGTLGVASVSGATSFASLVVDQTGVGDVFTASASGNPLFVIKKSGNVGIGTTLPTINLEVVGPVDTFLGVRSTGGKFAGLSAGTSGGTFQFDKTGNFYIHAADSLSDNSVDTTHNLTFTGGGSFGFLGINNISPTALLQVSGTGNALFDSTVKVGIGASSPLATFDVRGNLATTPVGSISGSTNMAALVVDQTGNGDIFTASASGNPLFVIAKNGNVGIGTSNPQGKLEVDISTVGDGFRVVGMGTNSPQFSLYNGGTQYGAVGLALAATHYSNIGVAGDVILRAINSTGRTIISNQNGQSILFTTGTFSNNDSAKVAITTAGALGIGTTSPLATLDVRGNSPTTPVASISGSTNMASLVVDQSGNGDIFTASASGLPILTISKAGNIVGRATTANTLGITDGTTAMVSFDSRNVTTPGIVTTTFNAIPHGISQQFASNTTYSTVAIPAWTWSNQTTSTTVTALNGLQLNIGGVTLNGNGATTVTTASSLYVSPPINNGVTITNPWAIHSAGSMRVDGGIAVNTSSLLATLDVRPNTTNGGTIAVASVSGQTSFASLVVDQTGNGDLFTASKSGLSLFTISKTGNVQIGTYASQPAQQSSGLVVSGNIGIQTSNPTNALDIRSVSNTQGAGAINIGAPNGGTMWGLRESFSVGELNLERFAAASWKTDLSITTGGNFSIGNGGVAFSPNASLELRGNSGTLAVASISGRTSFASLIVNNDGVGDLFTASSSGVNKFTVQKNGLILAPTYNAAGCTLKADTNGLITCGIDSSGGGSPFAESLGAIIPNNSTEDFLIGGQSTASAKFSYTGIATGQTIASVSGSLIVMANNGYGGQIGIGTTLPTADLTFGENGTTARTMNVLTRSTNAAGTPLSISAGTAGSGGSAFAGGALTLSAGNAAGTGNANGGDAIIRVGTSVGSGTIGTFRFQDTNANNYLTISYSSPTTTMTCGLFGSNNCILKGGSLLNLASNNSVISFSSGASGNTEFARMDSVGRWGFNSTSPLGTLDIRPNTTNGGTIAVASVSGATSFASLVVDQSGAGSIFAASSSGATRFVITGNGKLQLFGGQTSDIDTLTATTLNIAATNATTLSLGRSGQGITLPGFTTAGSVLTVNGSGNLTATAQGIASQCLISQGASTPSWGSCISGGTGSNWWTLNSGAGTLYPANATVDLLIGGVSTSSASFHVFGANALAGTQAVASISANTSYSAFVIDQTGSGDILTASASGLPLFTITKTGNVQIGTYASQPLQQSNSLVVSGNVGIGTTNLVSKLTLDNASLENAIRFDESGTIRGMLGISGSSGNIVTTSADNDLVIRSQTNLLFGTSGDSERMRITTSGTVGIGTTSPLATLDVRPNTTNGGTISVASVSGATSFASLVVDQSGSGDIFTASASGLPLFTITKAGTITGVSGRVSLTSNNVLNTSVTSGPTAVAGDIWYDSSAQKYKINENGATKTLCNTTDADCGNALSQTLTSNTTYVKASDAQLVIVEAVGAGGGGAGAQGSTTAAIRSGGGGGGGGVFVSKTFLASDFVSTVQVQVPSGGAGGIASASGAIGGSACLSSAAGCGGTIYLQAYGGGGGGTTVSTGAGGGGGAGATATGSASINQTGGAGGEPGGSSANGSNTGQGGAGGGTSANGGVAGGTAFGGGGGGGADSKNGSANSGAGGDSFWSGAGGGAGGSTGTTCTSRTGGAGGGTKATSTGNGGTAGTTSGGAGGNGDNGNSTMAGEGGGGGGSLCASGTGGAGGNGGAPGGGGGGGGAAAAASSTTGGAGGTGGRAEVRVWTVRGVNADLAEIYGTNDSSLDLADVVSLDPAMKAGVRKSQGAYDKNLMGVFSTAPAQIIGGIEDSGARGVPIALAGRVPVKVVGEIKPGDYLTSSNIPGIAMKAVKAGPVIGQAMGSYDGKGLGFGIVVMFVHNGYYNGESTQNVYAGLATDSTTFSQAILRELVRESSFTLDSSASASEIFTDRVVAGLEIITPKVTADEVSLDTLKSASGSDISVDLSDSNKLIIQNPAGNQVITFDSSGSAYFSGTITADRIVANKIEGLDLISNSIQALSDRIANLEGRLGVLGLATQSAQLSNNDSNNLILGGSGRGTSATGDLGVNGNGLFTGTLSSLTSVSTPNLIVSDFASFFGDTVFNKSVQFKTPPTFDSNTAGSAIIKKGTDRVNIAFNTEYQNTPLVTASISFDNIASTSADQNIILENQIKTQNYSYFIARKTSKGFTIVLNKAANEDIDFSWIALSVSSPSVSSSDKLSSTIPVSTTSAAFKSVIDQLNNASSSP